MKRELIFVCVIATKKIFLETVTLAYKKTDLDMNGRNRTTIGYVGTI